MQLDLRLILPGPTSDGVLFDADARLPSHLADGDPDEATVIAATAWLRERLAFPAPILETHPRDEGVPDGEPIPTLVMTEPAPAGWTPPDGFAFGPIPAAPAGLPALLERRAGELLVELRTAAPPPELRPRWARRGWHVRASAWMTDAMAAAGRPLLDSPQPFYLRGISALLRGRTAAGDVFLKAVFPPFHAEPTITRVLADLVPGAVPRVAAVEESEGWLIVDDLAAPWIYELDDDKKPGGIVAGAQALADLQASLAGEQSALAAAGCPDRPLDGLAAALDGVLEPTSAMQAEAPTSPERRAELVAAVRTAVEPVRSLGFPSTVVHGDFHFGNVALVGGRAVIIDWSDAAIGNPVVDLATWLAWSRDKPLEQQFAIDSWIDAWAGSVDRAAVRDRIDDILLLGAAYQVVSYDGILAALEPATRYTMAGGARHYLEDLGSRIDRR